jgi:hypothetical protein
MKVDLKILFYLLSLFEYCQNWLNLPTDDCHLSKITKLKKTKQSPSQVFYNDLLNYQKNPAESPCIVFLKEFLFVAKVAIIHRKVQKIWRAFHGKI